MASLILTNDDLSVHLDSRRLEVVRRITDGPRPQHEKRTVPLHDLDRVVVIGRPGITIPVLIKLMDEGVPCFFVSSHGRWRGSMTGDRNLNARRRLLQYERSRDRFFCLSVAQYLVYAKIRNCRRVLQRLAANRSLSDEQEHISVCNELKHFAQRAGNAVSHDELMGIEGIAAARYFQRLALFFPDNMPFNGRSRRPPRDSVNALLSWTYTMLLGEMEGIIRSHGLDAAIGVLHVESDNRPSLALDLIEPLRPAFADMLVLNILNHGILKQEHFEVRPDDGGTYLTVEARKPYFTVYEQTMKRRFAPRSGEPHTDFRKVMENEVCRYLRALEQDKLEPFFLMP